MDKIIQIHQFGPAFRRPPYQQQILTIAPLKQNYFALSALNATSIEIIKTRALQNASMINQLRDVPYAFLSNPLIVVRLGYE